MGWPQVQVAQTPLLKRMQALDEAIVTLKAFCHKKFAAQAELGQLVRHPARSAAGCDGLGPGGANGIGHWFARLRLFGVGLVRGMACIQVQELLRRLATHEASFGQMLQVDLSHFRCSAVARRSALSVEQVRVGPCIGTASQLRRAT